MDRAGTKLTIEYDRDADILHLSSRPPYREQVSEEIGDDVIARVNPESGEIESLEVLFFAARVLSGEPLELPLSVSMRRLD